MGNEMQTHSTNVALCEPAPAEVAVGSPLVLKIKVLCPAGCDLRATPLEVTAPDGLVTMLAADAGHAPSEATRTTECVAVMSLLAVSRGIGRRVPTW